MVRTTLAAALLLLAPFAARADDAASDSFLPLGREWAGDADLPRPYGIGIDLFSMNQDYDIERLSFVFPGVTLPDPNVIDVKSRIHFEDAKLDAWIFPFLNVFAVLGHVHARTFVDLSGAQGLPVPLGSVPVRYSGQVFGGGFTVAYGGEHWLASVTGSYADTDLSGDFESNVHSTSWQPRLGWRQGPWTAWVGAMYLEISEHHQGAIVLGPLGSVPFDVVLKQGSDWNPAAGVHYAFGDSMEITFEVGGGDRTTTLLNLGYRFE